MKFMLPTFSFKLEKWKWNKEYEIFVSNKGNFRNANKKNIPFLVRDGGYLAVKTPYGLKSAHRLVMLTWRPIPNAESLTIDHKNHNKRDNTLENLEWVTREENLKRAENDYIADAVVVSEQIANQIAAGKKIRATKKGSKELFSSINEAAIWALQKNGTTINSEHQKTAIKKIRNAITQQKIYSEYKWQLV